LGGYSPPPSPPPPLPPSLPPPVRPPLCVAYTANIGTGNTCELGSQIDVGIEHNAREAAVAQLDVRRSPAEESRRAACRRRWSTPRAQKRAIRAAA
jgi:hypothetical protein